MFFDRPARFLYRHGMSLDGALRVFSTTYRYILSIAVILLAAWIARLVLTKSSVLSLLGVTRP